MLPFEQQLTAEGIPLRGFANYRDTALTEAEWTERLYGADNFTKLTRIKACTDPEGLFTSNAQSIPLPCYTEHVNTCEGQGERRDSL